MLEFNEENWNGCLESLGFTEQKNPNGGYDVYDEKGIPKFQYETEEEKKYLYYFLSGTVWWNLHKNYG